MQKNGYQTIMKRMWDCTFISGFRVGFLVKDDKYTTGTE